LPAVNRSVSVPLIDSGSAIEAISGFATVGFTLLVWRLQFFRSSIEPRLGPETKQARRSIDMYAIAQIPIVIAAIQYSVIYMLLGGGLGGAVIVYIIAKLLGR
jgi:hypothetical protein